MLELPLPIDDGLVIADVGGWARDKHHFLLRYMDAFVTAMRKKPWGGLHYIDLFAGPGISRLRGSGRLVWGSPLIAAHAGFTKLHLCESDSNAFESLVQRLNAVAPSTPMQVLNGDANALIKEIVAEVPERTLSLVFLDPYSLELDFATVRQLATRRADLIIYFPDKLDIQRNVDAYYFDNPQSNLDRVLGSGVDWRSIRARTPRDRLAGEFRKLYCDQLRRLGYKHFESEPIPSTGRQLYSLIFCSGVKLGADIWRRTSLKKPDGQTSFDFE